MMLGVARPTVAVVAGKLQNAGLIKYHRGQLTIVDREQLEAAACECYRTAANLLATVVPAPGNKRKRNRRKLTDWR
jgi:Mn-dependent DtxR family transcriptional regulator